MDCPADPDWLTALTAHDDAAEVAADLLLEELDREDRGVRCWSIADRDRRLYCGCDACAPPLLEG